MAQITYHRVRFTGKRSGEVAGDPRIGTYGWAVPQWFQPEDCQPKDREWVFYASVEDPREAEPTHMVYEGDIKVFKKTINWTKHF